MEHFPPKSGKTSTLEIRCATKSTRGPTTEGEDYCTCIYVCNKWTEEPIGRSGVAEVGKREGTNSGTDL